MLDTILQELREYFTLRKDYTVLTIVEKLSILLSAFVLFLVLFFLALLAGVYVLLAVHAVLSPLVGTLASVLILVVGIAALMFVVYALRERLIRRPILRLVARVFLSNSNTDPEV